MESSSRQKLGMRVALAITAMVLFYASCAAIVAGLVYGGWLLIGLLGETSRIRAIIGIGVCIAVCWGIAGTIIWSILPRAGEFRAPGPRIERDDQPELFREIDAVAAATGQKVPDEVYLLMDFNAFVTERSGFLGFGTRRIMGIGLPLIQTFSVSQLRGVIAHEFGHFHGGDVKLSAFIYRTRQPLVEATTNLEATSAVVEHNAGAFFGFIAKVIQMPFAWYKELFLRMTASISRQQEVAADALACRVAGSAAVASGFERMETDALAFDVFLRAEWEPLVANGKRVSVIDGFERFRASPSAQRQVQRYAEARNAARTAHPHDSHPPTEERIAAAHALGLAVSDEDSRPALVLLRDPRALEAECFSDAVAALPLSSWDEAMDVYIEGWKARVAEHWASFEGLSMDALPFEIADIRELLARSVPAGVAEAAHANEIAAWTFRHYLAVVGLCLLERGFTATTSPGEPITFVRDDVVIVVQDALREAMAGKTTPDAWREEMARVGLLGVTTPAHLAVAPKPEAAAA